jgi:hypothetical protein
MRRAATATAVICDTIARIHVGEDQEGDEMR